MLPLLFVSPEDRHPETLRVCSENGMCDLHGAFLVGATGAFLFLTGLPRSFSTPTVAGPNPDIGFVAPLSVFFSDYANNPGEIAPP